MNLLKALALAAYALTSWIFIYILSTNDYEWMVGEKDADGSAMTICSLPLRNDDYSDIAPLMMIVFVSIGLIMGVRHMRRQRLLYIDGAHWFNYIACNRPALGDHRVGGTKVGSKASIDACEYPRYTR
jgi:hypothetical protein